MGKPFEIDMQLGVDAGPDDIWQAIATGPGIDSWFMVRDGIDARSGGTVRNTFGGHTQTSEVTSCEAWQESLESARMQTETRGGAR
jgi:uncharacterized protein YndB with AHSA1/START domain